MARTIQQIQNEIIAAKNADNNLSSLNSTSNVAIWRLWTYIVAVCIYTLEVLFDGHKAEVQAIIAQQKKYSLEWLAYMAKQFQYGFDLVPGTDYYDNTGIDAATIESSRVIKFAACEELMLGVRLKVATLVNGELAPVPEPQFTAFKAYMERIKPLGLHLENYYVNTTSDSLKLTIRVAYNPLVLNSTGARLDGTANTPVLDAINDYLINGIDFNGLFKPLRLEDYVQSVGGIDNVHTELVQARYGANPYASIGLKYRPFSGYLRFVNPSDLVILYEPM